MEDKVNHGIDVVAEVSLGKSAKRDEIKVTFAPTVETLLPQAKNLFQRVQTRARAMAFQEMSNKFMAISESGVFPEYTYKPIQAHVIISMPRGIVTGITSPEVEFVPVDMANACVFQQEDIDKAVGELLMQLLSDFAARGGH